MSATAELAEFVAGTGYDDLPNDVLDNARRALFNVVGVTVAGARAPVGRQLAGYVTRQFSTEGDVTVVCHGDSSPAGAALANGAFPSVHHYDDTFDTLLAHPSASAFPAAHAAAAVTDSNGRDLLAGYVLGIETTYHVGHSLDPEHADHGWHSTGTFGTFGAVAAAGSVLGLTPGELRHAVGIVASGSSALRRNIGTMTNQLHTGHAAQVGLRAALLAGDGFSADEAVLDGGLGYGTVMKPGGEFDAAEVTGSLGEEWGTLDLGLKPYPSASISHGALAALQRLLEEKALSGTDVASVTVHLDPSLSDVLGSSYPRDGSDAHASIKYCLAVALEKLRVDLPDFTAERVSDPAIRAEWEKITCDFSEPLGDGYREKGARVTVRTTDGREFARDQRRPPGSPDNPLSEAELKEKFARCTARDSVDADRMLSLVRALEDTEAFDEFIASLGRFDGGVE